MLGLFGTTLSLFIGGLQPGLKSVNKSMYGLDQPGNTTVYHVENYFYGQYPVSILLNFELFFTG